jgi:cytochrome b6-f complex iron-sulfur subunit
MRGILLNDRGRISAVSGVCTHLGCLLRPNPSDRSLDCPCHSTSFDWSGRVVRSEVVERPAALPHFESRVRDGQIEVFVV